ncbi:MAG: FAD-dependent oxidoreductase [Erythrobacter sp.]
MQSDHVLLIGGGHAHVAVLADWIKRGLPSKRATLLTPTQHLRYSGMVPGWIAGQYARDAGTVDLAALARRAGAELLLDKCAAIDPETRTVLTMQNGVASFDIASIDVGGVGQAARLLGDDPRLLDVRPIDAFVDQLAKDIAQLRQSTGRPAQIAVIGGGAGGVELAFALRNCPGHEYQSNIEFITGDAGLLPGFSQNVVDMVGNELSRQGMGFLGANARIEGGVIRASRTTLQDIDIIVAAMGSGAPEWPGKGGLACDADGFIAVDAHQCSISHPYIFAVGDVAARQDREVPHSGVHAVMAGPILAQNLRAAAKGDIPTQTYHPRSNSLYLIATGDGGAIASYGRLCAKGRWVGRLKRWIDNRWISKYARLARGG